MKKKLIAVIIAIALMLTSALALTACGLFNKPVDEIKDDIVTIIGEGFTKDTTVEAEEVSADNEEALVFIGGLKDKAFDKEAGGKFYDISLKEKGVKIQPKGTVEVSVKKPDDGGTKYKAFHLKADKTVEELQCRVSGDNIIFKTSGFSLFYIVRAEEFTVKLDIDKGGKVLYSFNLNEAGEGEYAEIDASASGQFATQLAGARYIGFRAEAQEGYVFTGWSVSVSGTDFDLGNQASYKFKVGEFYTDYAPLAELLKIDITFHANFEPAE